MNTEISFSKLQLLSFLFLLPLLVLGQQKKDSIMVFYLGGQSNMQGYGYIKNLPKV